MFSRGMDLAPYGSVQDRVMREMVGRERAEKVAHMDAIAKMIARVFNVDSDRVFGPIVAEYATEVYQESYDADLLRRKIAARRAVQAQVIAARRRDGELIQRLDRMGEYYDQQEAARGAAAKAGQKPKQNK
jgi:hypothetical protein